MKAERRKERSNLQIEIYRERNQLRSKKNMCLISLRSWKLVTRGVTGICEILLFFIIEQFSINFYTA